MFSCGIFSINWIPFFNRKLIFFASQEINEQLIALMITIARVLKRDIELLAEEDEHERARTSSSSSSSFGFDRGMILFLYPRVLNGAAGFDEEKSL